MHGETIAEILMHYMTRLRAIRHIELAANSHNAGILLQKLPLHGGVQKRIAKSARLDELCSIVKTVGADELLNTEADTLMHHCFGNTRWNYSTEQNVQFGLPAHRKSADMLKMLRKTRH